jgi:hypothetical protein
VTWSLERIFYTTMFAGAIPPLALAFLDPQVGFLPVMALLALGMLAAPLGMIYIVAILPDLQMERQYYKDHPEERY